jgi:3-methyladenine DNA glycosylase AlkD
MSGVAAWDVSAALGWLKRKARKSTLASMARYNIPSDTALGVSMKEIQTLAREIGRDHALAEKLWQSGIYEAQLLAAYVDDPAQVTAAQMDRWCRGFGNWAVCDTVCFAFSIERRMPGPRCTNGRAAQPSTKSGLLSRCYGH